MNEEEVFKFFYYIQNMDEETYKKILRYTLEHMNSKFPFEVIEFFSDSFNTILLIIKYIKNKKEVIEFLSNSNDYFKIISYVAKQGLEKFLKEDFKYRLTKVSNKLEFYNKYKKYVDDRFIKIYWDTLSSNEKKQQIISWFKAGILLDMIELLKSEIITEINRQISFENDDFDEVLKILPSFQLKNVPNKIFLRETIIDYSNDKLDKIKEEISKLNDYDNNLYKVYLFNFYKSSIKKEMNLERLFAKTIIEEKIIIEVFKELIEILDDKSCNRLFLIWIEAIESDFYYKTIQDEVLKIFINKVMKIPKSQLTEIHDFIEKHIRGQKSEEKFKDVFENIEEAKTSPIKRYIKQAKSLFETTTKLFKRNKGE